MKLKKYLNFIIGIPGFWKRQENDWKITVIRTSLERLGYYVIYPYLSIFIIALGATKTQLGLITCIGMLLAGLISPYGGQIIDKKGPKGLYIFGIAFLFFAYLGYAIAPVWQVAAVAMIFYYIGNSTSIHSCSTICGNCLTNCDRGRGMLICESLASGLLGMAGPLIAAWILSTFMGVKDTPTDADDIRVLFYIPVAISILTLLIVVKRLSNQRWTVKSSQSGMHVIKDGIALLKGNKNTKKWLVINTIKNLPTGMVLAYWQVFAGEVKGADVATLSLIVAASGLTSVFFGYPIGALSDKFGRKKVLCAIIPLFWISIVLLLVSKSPVWLVVSGILQGFYYISSPLMSTISRELVPQRVMGRWIGLTNLVSQIVSAIMALTSGIIYDHLGEYSVFILFLGIDILVRYPLLISMPETLHFDPEKNVTIQ